MPSGWATQIDRWWTFTGKPWLSNLPAGWAWAIVLLAASVIAWALFGETVRHALRARRPWARPPRRCPECWYDMSAHDGRKCPECGREAGSERRLHRRRRRPRLALLALVLVLAGLGELAWLRWGEGRWIRRAPLAFVMPRLTPIQKPKDPYAFQYQYRVLVASLNDGLTGAQWREALTRTEFAVARPRADAADPVTIDLREPYWTNFLTLDVATRPGPAPGDPATLGVVGYTPPAPDGSRTVVLAGPAAVTVPAPQPGRPVVLTIRAYHSAARVRDRLAWEGELEVEAPVVSPGG